MWTPPAWLAPTLSSISALIVKHEEILIILALAMIVTMPEVLPWPFSKVEIFNWTYGWMHNGLKTFVSMRQPSAIAKTETKEVSGSSGTEKITTSSVEVSTAPTKTEVKPE